MTSDAPMRRIDTDLWSGLIRLHVLHHAAQDDLFGLGMIQELRRHGYEISPGTLYPMLHGLERRGYLKSRLKRGDRGSRRVYRITAEGRTALGEARRRVQELFHELFEEAP